MSAAGIASSSTSVRNSRKRSCSTDRDDRKRYAIDTLALEGLQKDNEMKETRIQELTAEVSRLEAIDQGSLQSQNSGLLELNRRFEVQVLSIICTDINNLKETRDGELEKARAAIKQFETVKAHRDKAIRDRNVLATERDEYKEEVRKLKAQIPSSRDYKSMKNEKDKLEKELASVKRRRQKDNGSVSKEEHDTVMASFLLGYSDV
ncbi:hypothetical protein BT96DRAFT_407412 [Gymnopus androsaceus JB14]|uniref:Uncharacterized protein n=1 Tax=Gymnopus androsaceus JB14 TaxID=1447944 RepID=A0A6A4GVX6_9AGAR|nr:hypothetical protein BT96DRAFT_407412 [Gymnopus androsaceus JB14]